LGERRTSVRDDLVEMEITSVGEGFRRQDNRDIQPKKGSSILSFHIDISDVRSQMESATVLLGLQRMYGDSNMRFKSTKQAEAVKLALKREKDILAVIPTGGGKSLIFQLPAFLEMDLTTVVIVPFVALVEEMDERCKDLGLSCQVWKGQGGHVQRSQILIVGVEHAVTSEFQQLLIQLESTENLGRIVLDECQILLTQRDFRPVVRRLGSVVRCVSVQLILLTATLPVGMEERIRIILGCEEWIVVRLKEDRKELKYMVKDVGQNVHSLRDLNEEVANVMSMGLQQFQELDRGIIYCLKRSWTEELSDFVNQRFGRELCGVYHAEMDLVERQQSLKRWKNGEIVFLAATSALGMGIDYGEVRLIIHQGHGRSLIDFCQSS
jgi:superfamily II DNA helicase RecQ